MIDEIVQVDVRDGTSIGARIYRPDGSGPYPALFGAAPYRFDNNSLPASPQFLWRETGPIEWYVEQGYAYVHMDVRGSGRSGGEFEFLGRKRAAGSLRRHRMDRPAAVVERQGWRHRPVLFLHAAMVHGRLAPPALACLAAHDGLADVYRAGIYHGGIPCDFFSGYWWYQNRFINRFPANGPSREQETDLTAWSPRIRPTTSSGANAAPGRCSTGSRCRSIRAASGPRCSCTRAATSTAIIRAAGPKKLRMSGVPNAWAAAAEFSSVEFHKTVLLPFYDHYLKGKQTDYAARPNVEYAVRGSNVVRRADSWPPPGTRYTRWHLNASPSGSVSS